MSDNKDFNKDIMQNIPDADTTGAPGNPQNGTDTTGAPETPQAGADTTGTPATPQADAGATGTPETPPVDESTLPRVEDLSEEELCRILKEDAEQIEPPESLSPKNIEKRLIGVRRDAPRRTSRIAIIAGMAACLVFGVMAGLLTFALIRGGDSGTRSDVVAQATSEPDGEGDAGSFSGNVYDELSYGDVCQIINHYNENNQRHIDYDYVDAVEEASDESAGAAAPIAESSNQQKSAEDSSAGASSDYSRTDEQVEGVEEGDIVKTDGKHIFTIETTTFGFTIHVIEPNGSASKEVGLIDIPGSSCVEAYISDNMFITIGSVWGQDEGIIYDDNGSILPQGNASKSGRSETTISFIDISDPSNPKLVKTLNQTGIFNTSRISGGYLYTFTEDVYYNENDYKIDDAEKYIPQINGHIVPAGKIVRAGSDDTNNYMVMTSVRVNGEEDFADTLAVLGGGATYYMSTEHIYIARYTNTRDLIGEFIGNSTPISALTKFTYRDGSFSKDKSTSFRGMIGNSYYMHEYKGNFCFLYTSYDSDYQPINGLVTLDPELNKLGELRGIAPNENIYSSYYIENMAYFVTYRNTDPVFAVDIADPKNPVLKSELKLPGFSSYLHSFGPDKLIGIGYGDSTDVGWDGTAKLSLFGISGDYQISELSRVFAEEGARHIADQNHRAVFVDEKRMLVGFGLISYRRDADGATDRNNHYAVYQLKGDKLVPVMDTGKLADNAPVNGVRGVRIGETFYVCNVTGVLSAYSITGNGEKWKKL